MQKSGQSQRIEIFDGMRGLASVIVMIFHMAVWTVYGYSANEYKIFADPFWRVATQTPLKMLWGGNEAVLVFYIIGGFVLARPYLSGRKLDFKPFILKRWIRLMLPYVLVIAVSVILIALFGAWKQETIDLSGSFNVKWKRVPNAGEMLLYLLGYDYNLNILSGAFWSMVQEWRLSFVLPFVAVALHRYSTWKVLVCYAVLQQGIEALTDWGMRSGTAWLAHLSESLNRTNYYALFFVMGAVLAKHLPAIRAFVREHRSFRILSAWAIPFLIPSQWILAALGLSFQVRHALLLSGLGIILFLLLCMESPQLTAFFKSKPLLLLGKLSFSLYLTHTTSIILFVTFLGQVIPPETALLLSPLFALPVAYLWQKHVETKCLSLLNHFKK
ncbi:acyltransferase [uncultured Trichococcus sp.]|uniref:acyltransferase family protein n=1 Tax=uncultured Trichococcus sp. TaxID=189665 RepID=UPI002A18A3AD|nr:acyltransferase [uncultured Trichococcus sp.]